MTLLDRLRLLRKRLRIAWRIVRYGATRIRPPAHWGTGVAGSIDLFGCYCNRCGRHSSEWTEKPECVGPTIFKVGQEQRQDSLYDQLCDLRDLALHFGLYDAMDNLDWSLPLERENDAR